MKKCSCHMQLCWFDSQSEISLGMNFCNHDKTPHAASNLTSWHTHLSNKLHGSKMRITPLLLPCLAPCFHSCAESIRAFNVNASWHICENQRQWTWLQNQITLNIIVFRSMCLLIVIMKATQTQVSTSYILGTNLVWTVNMKTTSLSCTVNP